MNAFILLVAAQSDGQVAQIARTFGVDWSPFGGADHQLFDRMCRSLQVRIPAHSRDAGTAASANRARHC